MGMTGIQDDDGVSAREPHDAAGQGLRIGCGRVWYQEGEDRYTPAVLVRDVRQGCPACRRAWRSAAWPLPGFFWMGIRHYCPQAGGSNPIPPLCQGGPVHALHRLFMDQPVDWSLSTAPGRMPVTCNRKTGALVAVIRPGDTLITGLPGSGPVADRDETRSATPESRQVLVTDAHGVCI